MMMELYFELLCIKQIKWRPCIISRQQHDAEEELRHRLQFMIFEEHTAIFATIDCEGACLKLLNLKHYLDIKHPETRDRCFTDDLLLVSADHTQHS